MFKTTSSNNRNSARMLVFCTFFFATKPTFDWTLGWPASEMPPTRVETSAPRLQKVVTKSIHRLSNPAPQSSGVWNMFFARKLLNESLEGLKALLFLFPVKKHLSRIHRLPTSLSCDEQNRQRPEAGTSRSRAKAFRSSRKLLLRLSNNGSSFKTRPTSKKWGEILFLIDVYFRFILFVSFPFHISSIPSHFPVCFQAWSHKSPKVISKLPKSQE